MLVSSYPVMMYPLLSLVLFSTISAVWWINATPKDPEVYFRLIIVWRSYAAVRSQFDHWHPQNIQLPTSSFPLFYIESNTLIRTLIECWFAVLATIALDLHSRTLDRYPVLSKSKSTFNSSSMTSRMATPVLIIDFGIQPFLVVLMCALSVVVTSSSSSEGIVTLRSHNHQGPSSPPRPLDCVEACHSVEVQSNFPIQKPLSGSRYCDSCESIEGGVQRSMSCNEEREEEEEGYHSSVTRYLVRSSDGKVERFARIRMDDTPPKPLQVLIKAEVHVHQEEI